MILMSLMWCLTLLWDSITIPVYLSLVGPYDCIPLIWETCEACDFGVWEESGVRFLKHHYSLITWVFPVSNHSQLALLNGCFPVHCENPVTWFQNGILPRVVYFTALKSCVSLSAWPEVLVNLFWMFPPGMNENKSLHWLCPVIMSLEENVSQTFDC